MVSDCYRGDRQMLGHPRHRQTQWGDRPFNRVRPWSLGLSLTLGITALVIIGPEAYAGIGSAPPQGPSRRQLMAQQIVDGLPPPPSFPTPDATADLSDFPAPPSMPGQSSPVGDSLYMVYVNGSSPLLLEQVRQVQPDALIQEYDGQPIILVGAYDNPELADQQIAALEERGIGASVSPVSSLVFEPTAPDSGFASIPELPPADTTTDLPSTPVAATVPSREFEFSPVPTDDRTTPPSSTSASSQPLADSSYYIVIPGSSNDLTQVRDQVLLLGARQDVVSQREQPLGPHVLVGPFADRQAASRWNRYFRDFGMNARVYYRR